MVNMTNVLLAMSNIPVDDPIAEIWGRGLQGGYKIIKYTGSLPITINANGDVLIDYRIYGASGGVGELTENLIDANKPGVQRVELEPNTDYCFCKYTGSGVARPQCNVYDENDNKLFGDYINVWVSYSFTNPSNGAYAIITFSPDVKGKLSFTKGHAANNNTLYPAKYIPYGYKLPMTVSDGNTAQTVPVYIGENQLGEDEYASFSEQKIYKRTENLIPSPEPQTQTGNGITAICDGNGVYTFTGTSTDVIRFEFPIEEFTTPNTSDTDFIVSLFNTKGLPMYNSIGIGSAFYINPVNRVIKNPSASSNKKVNKISFSFQPNTETNFTISPMLVLGTVAPSQFVPHIVPTDPPVPLPEIPTIDGETVIDYDGEPKPSQMYIKYKGKG